jgi:hypothetical protein
MRDCVFWQVSRVRYNVRSPRRAERLVRIRYIVKLTAQRSNFAHVGGRSI